MASTFKDFYRGDTIPLNLVLSNDGVPENLEGALITVTMKQDPSVPDAEADLQVKLTVPNGTDAQNGLATIVLESDDTESLEPGIYEMDIQRVLAGTSPPDVWTIFRQQVTVLEDITRDTI